jgi:hypothetical protein
MKNKIERYLNNRKLYKAMENKVIPLIVLLILFLPIVSANLGTFKQNSCVDIKTILNTSSTNISSISYPNSSIAVTNKIMTKNGLTFNYTFCNINEIGNYIYDYSDAEGNVYVNDFEVTYNGESNTPEKVYIYIIGLLALIGMIFALLYSTRFLPQDSRNQNGEIIQINFLKNLRPIFYMFAWGLFMAITFIVENICFAYLQSPMIGNLFSKLFGVEMAITIVAVPLSFIFLLKKAMEDKETQNMLNHGVPGSDM